MAQDFKHRVDIKLPAVPNVSDPQLHKEFIILYNSMRRLANWIENIRSANFVFADSMGVGALVNIFNDAGVPKARLAQHGVTECIGFVNVAATAGNVGSVTLGAGYLDIYSGLLPGQKLWLSATPGSIAGACPGAGCQRVGFALSSTSAWIQPVLL